MASVNSRLTKVSELKIFTKQHHEETKNTKGAMKSGLKFFKRYKSLSDVPPLE